MTLTDFTTPALNRRNLKDSVADFLRTQIFSGELKPGTKIDQDATAATLGVSKLPIREALIALESEALLINVPRRGAFVATLSQDDVRDHYAAYGLASAIAARRVSERLTDLELGELEAILEEMKATSDPVELEQLHRRFHRTINKVGGSQRLNAFLLTLSESLPTRFLKSAAGWPDATLPNLERVLDALRRRDPEAAAASMREHLREGGEYAIKVLGDNGFWD